MERKFYTDNFEQLLKEKSDEFRMYPSKRVWHSIYNDLHPGRKWPSIAVSMVLIFALLMTGYWNNRSTLASQQPASSNNIDVAATSGSGAPASHSDVALQQGTNTLTASNSPGSQNPASFNLSNTIAATQNINTLSSDKYVGPATSVLSTGNNQHSLATVHTRHNNVASSHSKIIVAAVDFNNTPSAGNSNNNGKLRSATNDIASNGTNATPFFNTDAGATFNTAPVVAAAAATATLQKLNTAENNNTTTDATAAIGNDAEKSGTLQDNKGTIISATTIAAIANNKANQSQSNAGTYKKVMSTEDKAWVDDYAFHNKSKRKKWQDRTSFEFYLTPGAVFGKLTNDAKYNLPVAAPSYTNGGNGSGGDANKAVNKKPGLGIEGGFSINYSLAKKLLVKAGVQANITSYGINAYETNHPVLSTLMLIDPNSGFPYMHSTLSTLSNIGGSQPVILHNQTFQVSIPLGFAFKLSGNDKLAWYTGASIQPSFVAGGKAYLISADRNTYVADPSLIRKWNLNTGIESYITYKFDGFTLQAGPQYRRQLMSTYYNKYTVNERLSAVGIKLGLIKNF